MSKRDILVLESLSKRSTLFGYHITLLLCRFACPHGSDEVPAWKMVGQLIGFCL